MAPRKPIVNEDQPTTPSSPPHPGPETNRFADDPDTTPGPSQPLENRVEQPPAPSHGFPPLPLSPHPETDRQEVGVGEKVTEAEVKVARARENMAKAQDEVTAAENEVRAAAQAVRATAVPGTHIFIEEENGDRSLTEFKQERNERRILLGGVNYEHVSEGENGCWVYRKM